MIQFKLAPIRKQPQILAFAERTRPKRPAHPQFRAPVAAKPNRAFGVLPNVTFLQCDSVLDLRSDRGACQIMPHMNQ